MSEIAATMKRCNRYLESLYPTRTSTHERVLEAGGGSFSHFSLPPGALLHVLDIEHGQLAKNDHSTLCIQGDIHRLPVSGDVFDMIVCFNVIEHLDAPQQALAEMVRTLAPGGILLLGCPERNSLKGWITRLTPLGFHRWYYHRVVGKQDRGDGHYDAFATPFRPIVSAENLKKWLAANRMQLQFFQPYDGNKEYLITRGSLKTLIFGLPYKALGLLGQWITLGRWRPLNSDLMLVAIKSADELPRV